MSWIRLFLLSLATILLTVFVGMVIIALFMTI